jgi:hypothetical protein
MVRFKNPYLPPDDDEDIERVFKIVCKKCNHDVTDKLITACGVSECSYCRASIAMLLDGEQADVIIVSYYLARVRC